MSAATDFHPSTLSLEDSTQAESPISGLDPVETALRMAWTLANDVQVENACPIDARLVQDEIRKAKAYYTRLNVWGVVGFLVALALGYAAAQF